MAATPQGDRPQGELETARLLLGASEALVSRTTLEGVLSLLVDIMMTVTGREMANVSVWEEEPAQLRVAVAHGSPPIAVGTVFAFDSMSSAMKRAIQMRTVQIADFDAMPEDERGLGPSFDLHMALYVPICFGEKLIGLVGLTDSGKRREFTASEIELAEGVATQAGVAIENARLLDVERVRAARLRALHDATGLVTSSLEPAEVVHRALESAEKNLGVSATSLWLLDPDEARLRLSGALGFPDEFFADFAEGLSLDAPHDVARAFRTGEPVLHEDTTLSHVPSPVADAYRRYGIALGALVVVPLLTQAGAIGAVTLAWPEPVRLSPEDHAFNASLANAFSTAIENARLYETVRDSEAKLSKSLAGARESELRLRTIVESMPVAVTLIDATGTMLEHNDAYRAIWHAEENDVPARLDDFRRLKVFNPETGRPLEFEEYPGSRVLATGEPLADVLYDVERLDGTHGTTLVSVTPVKDDDGKLTTMVMVTQDVTERRLQERLDRALTDISAAVTSTLSADEILRKVLLLGADAVGAETGFVTLLDDEGWLVAEADEISRDIVGFRFDYDELVGAKTAVESLRPVAVRDTRTDPRIHPESIRRLGGLAFIVVPLVTQGRPIGALAFVYRSGPQTYTDAQLGFVSRLQGVVTLALENALRYEHEHAIAETLQGALLTPPEPVEGLEVAYLYRPASAASLVGGDFFDLFQLDDDRVAVLIGDVSGKGIDAARLTALMRDGTRAYALVDPDPARAITRLNTLAHRSTPVESFATLFFGTLCLPTGEFNYCGAGHPSAIVIGHEGARLLESRSSVVGAFQGLEFTCDETRLDEGDVLFLYTDGVVEAMGAGEMFGEERLLEAVRDHADTPLPDLPQAVLEDVLAFCGGHLRDDTAILCVRRAFLAEK